MNDFCPVPITTGQSKLPLSLWPIYHSYRTLFEIFERGNESNMIFSRMFEGRDIQEKWMLQTETLFGARNGLFPRTRVESFVIKTVMDHGDAFARQTEKLHDISRGVFADGNDSVLSTRKPTDNHASVIHSFPVIFFGHVKRRE